MKRVMCKVTPKRKTPASAATGAGAESLKRVGQKRNYSKADVAATSVRKWTVDANLFVVAFAATERVLA